MSIQSMEDAAPTSSGRRLPLGKLVLAAIGIAFVGWVVVRVRAALVVRGEVTAEREQSARSAAARSGALATVSVIHPIAERWRPVVPLEGTLLPAREADLGFKVPGRLAAIRVRLGGRVAAGDELASLDAHEATAQAQGAEAQLRAAQAQFGLAEDAQARTSSLVSTGAASAASGVQVNQQRALVAAQVDASRAQLALAKANLANHVVNAPFAGYVTRVPSGPGAIVNPGVPLFHLQDTATLRLSGTLSEADRGLVRIGATVEISGREPPLLGRVSAVLPSVDPLTRRVIIEAQVKNEGDAILAGTFVRARLLSDQEIPVLRVPASALRPGSQDEVVVVTAGKLGLRRVTFSPGPGATLLVRRGLDARELLVAAPAAELREGEAVLTEERRAPVTAAAKE